MSLLRVFNNEELLEGSRLNDHIDFQKELNTSISSLIYQNAIHFTFYHEMAHLIQNSSLLEAGLYEQSDGEEYSERKHILELDADEYSALSIGAHTIQYAQNTFKEQVTSKHFEKLLTIVCISSMLYVLSFQTNRRDIYYKKRSHPHPIIRITRIIFVIIGYSKQALGQIGINNELDAKKIVNEATELAGELSIRMFGENLLDNYQQYLRAESENISKYIREMELLAKSDDTLAVKKWNMIARKLHEEGNES